MSHLNFPLQYLSDCNDVFTWVAYFMHKNMDSRTKFRIELAFSGPVQFLKISHFVSYGWKKVIKVWTDMKMSKWWQDSHFLVNHKKLIDIDVLTWLLVILQKSLMCTSLWRSRMLKAQQSRCEETSPAGNRISCCEYCCFCHVFPCFWTRLYHNTQMCT